MRVRAFSHVFTTLHDRQLIKGAACRAEHQCALLASSLGNYRLRTPGLVWQKKKKQERYTHISLSWVYFYTLKDGGVVMNLETLPKFLLMIRTGTWNKKKDTDSVPSNRVKKWYVTDTLENSLWSISLLYTAEHSPSQASAPIAEPTSWGPSNTCSPGGIQLEKEYFY